jgi:ubiquinone/menaquinone biosynthesis C-methylase UbiE
VLPVEDRTADLVWCRDVLVHVADLERAYHEFHRVLRDGGRTLVYQMFATDAGQVLRRRLRRRVQDAPAWPAHPSETTGRHAGVSSASGTIV